MRIESIYTVVLILFIAAFPAYSQEQQDPNEIIAKMQHDLNLSNDQVANITQIIERYTMASNDLQKSIEDGTINQSAIDSQKQQIKAAEDQGIAQYLRPDQLYEWNNIQSQMDQQKDKDDGEGNAGADEYSNLPRSSGGQ